MKQNSENTMQETATEIEKPKPLSLRERIRKHISDRNDIITEDDLKNVIFQLIPDLVTPSLNATKL